MELMGDQGYHFFNIVDAFASQHHQHIMQLFDQPVFALRAGRQVGLCSRI